MKLIISVISLNCFISFSDYFSFLSYFQSQIPILVDNKGQLKTKLYDKTTDFSFRMFTFHLYVAIFQQRLYTEYVFPNSYDMIGLLFLIMISFIDGAAFKKLLSHKFHEANLKYSLRRFNGHHHKCIDCYGVYVSQRKKHLFQLYNYNYVCYTGLDLLLCLS